MIFGFCLAIFGLTQSFTSPDQGLLDSRAQPEHRFWSFYQSAPFCRLHGADDRVAAGFAFCRRGREREEIYLSLCRRTDGCGAGDDDFARRHYQSSR